MISGFFLNACILITFISIAYIYLKDKEITDNSSISLKVILGFSGGGLGIVLMMYSVYFVNDIILDFRYVPLLLTAIYGSLISTIIATMIIGLFRIIYFGISQPSIIGLVATLIIGIGFSIISRIKLCRKNMLIVSIIYLFCIVFIGLFINLGLSKIFYKTLLICYVGNTLVFSIVFFYTENLNDLVKLNKKLKHEATKDHLTGLNNVRQFEVYYQEVSQLALRKGENLSLLFIDIDFFKKINDTYGHTVGDEVLRMTADLLIESVRVFDIVSRNGGEEFSVLLLDCSESHAIKIAERVRKEIENHKFIIFGKVNLSITISIGVSTYSDNSTEINKLLENADKALYEAKRTGRNKVVIYK